MTIQFIKGAKVVLQKKGLKVKDQRSGSMWGLQMISHFVIENDYLTVTTVN